MSTSPKPLAVKARGNDEAISMNFLTNEVWVRWAIAEKGRASFLEVQSLSSEIVDIW